MQSEMGQLSAHSSAVTSLLHVYPMTLWCTLLNVPNKFYVIQFNPTISYLGLCLNEIILDVRKDVCGYNNGGIIFLVSMPEYTRNIHIFCSF